MKTNDKNPTAPGPAATRGADLAVAVVQSAQTQETEQIHQGEAIVPRDDYHGRGGLYRIVDGVRTRIAVTQPAAQTADTKETKQ